LFVCLFVYENGRRADNNVKHLMVAISVETCAVVACGETFHKALEKYVLHVILRNMRHVLASGVQQDAAT
jgi:hypothetical protein